MAKEVSSLRGELQQVRDERDRQLSQVQIYNARSAYHSSIRGSDTKMQHLMKLLEHDQYIHWHRLKDEVMVCDLFWCHPDAVKLCNACYLVFFIDNTYKKIGTDFHYLTLLE